jgi:hypothetical protein
MTLISLNQEVQISREVFGIIVPSELKFEVDRDFVFQATKVKMPSEPRVFALFRAPDDSEKSCQTSLHRLAQFANCYSLVTRRPVRISPSLGRSMIPTGGDLHLRILVDLRATELVAPEEAKRKFDDASKLSRIAIPGYLSNALTYYCRSTQAETKEEELIDLVISLESLFTLDVQELRYRLSLRRSYFLLPQDKVRRKKVFDLVYSACYLRSKILHNGKPLNPDDHTVVSDLRRVVRDSILALIALRHVFGDKDDLVNSIDSTIVEGNHSLAAEG